MPKSAPGTPFDSWATTFAAAAEGDEVHVTRLKVWADAVVRGIQASAFLAKSPAEVQDCSHAHSALRSWAARRCPLRQVFGAITPAAGGGPPRSVQSAVLGCEGGLEAQELVLVPGSESIACIIFWQPEGGKGPIGSLTARASCPLWYSQRRSAWRCAPFTRCLFHCQVTLSSKRVVRFGSSWTEKSWQQSPCSPSFDQTIPEGTQLLGACSFPSAAALWLMPPLLLPPTPQGCTAPSARTARWRRWASTLRGRGRCRLRRSPSSRTMPRRMLCRSRSCASSTTSTSRRWTVWKAAI